MPVSRHTSAGLSDQVTQTYARAELRLLRMMAKHLAAGHDAPDWMDAKLAELQMFRKRAQQVMADTTTEAVTATGEAVERAYRRGTAAGQGDLDAAGLRWETGPPRQAEYAVEALVRAQAGALEDVALTVVRATEDAYRDVVARASAGTLVGAQTRRDAAAEAVDDLARKGITGFTDTRGRRWGLEAYVDMATRTVTAKAAVAGHLDRLEDAGINLVMVSTSSRECALCRPWEGKVLSRGPYASEQTNVLTGRVEQVVVDGTVAGATAAGLFHPNCTHNLSAYIHGATKAGEATPNPKGYEAQQRQRQMERKVREWKRRQAAAITPEARRRAGAKVREWQGAIRAHVDTHGLPRKRWRESLDVTIRRPQSVPDVDLAQMDDGVLQAELADRMAAGDYGARFEALAAELDARDAEVRRLATLPEAPDPVADQAGLVQTMGGDWVAPDEGIKPRESRRKRDPEAELRDEYFMWIHSQWLRAEEDCRGHLLSDRGRFQFDKGLFSIEDLFTRKIRTIRDLASDELQEWFAQPGNQRLSFPEFRSMIRDDKAAREASQRLRARGWESEWG